MADQENSSSRDTDKHPCGEQPSPAVSATAALAPSDGGEWIEWSGDACPIRPATRVDVKFKNGKISRDLRASGWSWGKSQGDYSIVAYRIAATTSKVVDR